MMWKPTAAVAATVLVVMLLPISPVSACGGGCTAGWTPYTGISASITSPTTSNNGRGINAEVQFTCSATDLDRYQNADCSYNTPVQDGLTYTWTAQAGTFPYGNTGSVVTWKAPANPGEYWVKVTVNDDGSPTGTDDPAVSPTRTMEVIRLDKVRLYFYCDGTAFPRVNIQSFNTRAVIWATVTQQRAYCGLSMNPALWAWWNPGSDEFRGDQTPPHWWENAEPHFDQAGTIYPWPSNWPTIGGSDLDIQWTQMYHHGGDPQDPDNGDYDRHYSYNTETSYLSDSWGETNRTYNTPGVHRLRAVATLEGGHAWPQVKHSADFDNDGQMDNTEKARALRISIKDPNIYQEPDPPPADTEQRQLYLEWLSVYQGVPYEWGGEGHGGKDSGGNWAGGPGAYEGYGMDCSGLVSCAAYMVDADQDGHDYNWGWWRKATCDRLAGGRLTEVSTDLGTSWRNAIQPGDILLKPHHHVITYVYVEGTGLDRRWYCIEAHGSPVNEVWISDQDPDDPDRWWTDADLDDDCGGGTHTHRHWNPDANPPGYETCTSNPVPQRYRARSLDPS
jgi:hypothetical protein